MQVEKPTMERESEETSGSAGPTAPGSDGRKREGEETRGSDGQTTVPESDGRGEETRGSAGRDGETTAAGSVSAGQGDLEKVGGAGGDVTDDVGRSVEKIRIRWGANRSRKYDGKVEDIPAEWARARLVPLECGCYVIDYAIASSNRILFSAHQNRDTSRPFTTPAITSS